MSQLKIKDGNSWINIPAGGVGVPSGGTAGQVLTKSSATDYATEWALPLSMKLLWTNPSPSSDFAVQTVTFSDDYDLYVVIFKRDATGDVYVNSTIFLHGHGVFIIHGSGYSNKVYTRDAAWHSGGGLEWHSAYAASSTAVTNVMIPLYIYGIKGMT